MVRMSDFQTAQFIGMNVLCQTQLAQVSFRIKSHNAHFSEQPSHALGANQDTQTNQIINHSQYAFCWMLHKLFIHQAHQFKVRLAFFYRIVIQHAAIQSEQFTLATLAQILSRGYYFFEDFSIPNCSEALLQKSTSTSKRPIFSYSAFSRLAASSSGALLEKISAPRLKNSRFQLEIICGCTSKRLASSLSVSASLIASIATWALKAALCFFRGVIIGQI